MMTPGDFASLQEGREGLSTEDYIAWKLPYVPHFLKSIHSQLLGRNANNVTVRKKTKRITHSRLRLRQGGRRVGTRRLMGRWG